MTIHHSQQSAATRMGFTLEEQGNYVRAFQPSTGTQVFGVSAKDAVAQISKIAAMYDRDTDLRFRTLKDSPTQGYLQGLGTGLCTRENGTPIELFKLWGPGKLNWMKEAAKLELLQATRGGDRVIELKTPEGGSSVSNGVTIEETFEPDPEPKPATENTPLIKRSEKGVPLDGAIAYKEGIMAADNPFEEGSEEGDEWDAQWDQAADDAPEDEGGKGGSVVASKYRTKYKEEGHPNHCGDWLADLLNNYCVGDKNTDLETAERIFNRNGIETSKYKREGVGWQGRIRMTGRNLLAKQVFLKKKIEVPGEGDEWRTLDAPADWLAAQRYSKPKE